MTSQNTQKQNSWIPLENERMIANVYNLMLVLWPSEVLLLVENQDQPTLLVTLVVLRSSFILRKETGIWWETIHLSSLFGSIAERTDVSEILSFSLLLSTLKNEIQRLT